MAEGDEQADARYVVDKAAQMRIFADEQGRFNRSVLDVNGELLVVSQFTLYADTRRGRRPDFTRAAAPDAARRLYEYTVALFQETGLRVAAGEFRAYMYVQLENDGPVTILVDSADPEPAAPQSVRPNRIRLNRIRPNRIRLNRVRLRRASPLRRWSPEPGTLPRGCRSKATPRCGIRRGRHKPGRWRAFPPAPCPGQSGRGARPAEAR